MFLQFFEVWQSDTALSCESLVRLKLYSVPIGGELLREECEVQWHLVTLPRCPKDSVGFGSLFLEVRSTPGYTPESVTYAARNAKEMSSHTHTPNWGT